MDILFCFYCDFFIVVTNMDNKILLFGNMTLTGLYFIHYAVYFYGKNEFSIVTELTYFYSSWFLTKFFPSTRLSNINILNQ